MIILGGTTGQLDYGRCTVEYLSTTVKYEMVVRAIYGKAMENGTRNLFVGNGSYQTRSPVLRLCSSQKRRSAKSSALPL